MEFIFNRGVERMIGLFQIRYTSIIKWRNKGIAFIISMFLVFSIFVLSDNNAQADEATPIWSYSSNDQIMSVATSSDGNYIVTGSYQYDDRVILHQKGSNTPLWTYETEDIAWQVDISSDGNSIAAGSNDNYVYYFTMDSGNPQWTYQTGHVVHAVAISSDGNYIAAGSWDNYIYLFQSSSNTPVWSYNIGTVVKSVSISGNGDYLVAAGFTQIFVFSRLSNIPLWIATPGGGINDVEISQDGNYLSVGTTTQTVAYQRNNPFPLWSYPSGGVWKVSMSSDGAYISAGGSKVMLFSILGNLLWYDNQGVTLSVSISADGNYIAAGGNKMVLLYQMDSATPVWYYVTGDTVTAVAISSNSYFIVAGSLDSDIYLFNRDISPEEDPPTYPQAITNPQIEDGEKGDDVLLKYDIYNGDSRSIEVLLNGEGTNELGDSITGETVPIVIPSGETKSVSIHFNNIVWNWNPAHPSTQTSSDVTGIHSAVDLALQSGIPGKVKFAQKLKTWSQIGKISTTWTIAGGVFASIDLLMTLHNRANIVGYQIYSFSIGNTVTYLESTYPPFTDIIANFQTTHSAFFNVPAQMMNTIDFETIITSGADIATIAASAGALIAAGIFTLGTGGLGAISFIASAKFIVAATAFEAIWWGIDKFGIQSIINEDPPDPNYMTYDRPSFFIPSIPEYPFDYLYSQFREAVILSGEILDDIQYMFKSIERYEGARLNSDSIWCANQLGKVQELVRNINYAIQSMDSYLDEVFGYLINDNLQFSPSEISYIQQYIQIHGLPQEEIDMLEAMGMSESKISEYKNMLINGHHDWLGSLNLLTQYDKLHFYVPISINDGPIGFDFDDIPDIDPPVASIEGASSGNEASPIPFDASESSSEGGIIISYEWDFDGDNIPDRFGMTTSYTWFDNCIQTISLTITVEYQYVIEGSDGSSMTITITKKDTSSTTVTVLNFAPEVQIDEGFMLVDFTLRTAGEKWHDTYFTLYENNEPIAALHTERYPGDPDKQADTVYDVYIDMGKRYHYEVTFNPYADDNPINGQLNGANPCWVNLTFEDGSWELLHHTFNVQQSIIRDSDHWLHVEPWQIDLSPYFVGHVATWRATATDVGTDDLELTWEWGDGTVNTVTFWYWDGSNPDGGSTPYDEGESSYPMMVSDEVYHTYMYEGDFIVTLTCDDEPMIPKEEGDDFVVFDVEAIHTDHTHPIK